MTRSTRLQPEQRKTKRFERSVDPLEAWFSARGWQPFDYQRQVWEAYLAGQSGLVHAPTGTGKTLAVWGGPLIEAVREQHHEQHSAQRATSAESRTAATSKRSTKTGSAETSSANSEPALRVLWLTPLRALAADTESALQEAVAGLGLNWRVERRTGDTPTSQRQRQRERWPQALITTPESLSILLSHPETLDALRGLRAVVVDEWHELMGSKRGVQTELCLARLRQIAPSLRTWGLSATMADLPLAMATLLGPNSPPGRLITQQQAELPVIESVLPATVDRFPWAGHLGLKLLPQVIERIAAAGSSLVFTNTRSQAESWYRAILDAAPDWAGWLGLHHGSLDRSTRGWVEQQLASGRLKAVVCTSSLDLGVDFPAVDQVLQIGSPKGIARLLQRAGRSGHRPGGLSRLVFVPTHAWELVEIAAVRDALRLGRIEPRPPWNAPIDVLVQHVVTMAIGGGFDPDQLFDEIRQTQAYAQLDRATWNWVLDFVTRGGQSLRAYPEFRRVSQVDGRCVVEAPEVIRRHRQSIGTISSDASLRVKYLRGASLGTVEESFIQRLEPGDRFHFGGQLLELVRVHNMTAYVRRAKGTSTTVPRWYGGKLPLSTELAEAVLRKLAEADQGSFNGPEMTTVRPVVELQRAWSHLPQPGELLIERVQTREGHHLFLYPLAGRLAHEGLAPLLAWRLARLTPASYVMSVNDYGLELLSDRPAPLDEGLSAGLFSATHAAEHIEQSLNAAELARRQFRDIAQIAGLVHPGHPGQPKSARQLQSSSNLLYDVFVEYDPEHLLLAQARQEVLDQQLELSRIVSALERMSAAKLVVTTPPQPTPLAFPLLVDRLRERVSSERLIDRVQRMQAKLERSARSVSG
ncbi:MAG: ligase-associated DNA damage response DEXH box helicase [Pirellulales bacterium]